MTPEVTGPNSQVVELMEQGATVLRIENENLQAMALQRPRRIQDLTHAAIDELKAFPRFAQKAYYSIPYKDRSTGVEKTVMVEGPSIKAANALARHWGNNSSGFRIVGGDEERVTIQGVFIDHETGMRRTAEISVSRKARKRDGTYYFLQPDRLNIAIQAGGSKAVRNAILNALPIGLVDEYFGVAKGIAARGGRPEPAPTKSEDTAVIAEQMEKSLMAFETLGVERAEVADYINRHPELSDEEAVSAHLVGLLNALEENQTTVEEVFTVPDKPIAEPQRGTDSQVPPSLKKKEPPVPEKKHTMTARMTAGTCGQCKKGILQGQQIWKDGATGKWAHLVC